MLLRHPSFTRHALPIAVALLDYAAAVAPEVGGQRR